ncbi:MAG: hypothetical protein ACOYVF_14345 [Candidatus Zixiibacteriota bacterium]
MKIAFDFVCDEAPIFARIGQRYVADGHEVYGLTMGRRWKSFWQQFPRTYPIDIQTDNRTDLRIELERLEKEYGSFQPASFLTADRFLSHFPRDEQSRALVNTFKAIENAFFREKPDYYFSTGIAYLYNLVTLAVCRRFRIPHLSLYSTRGSSPRFTVSLGKGGSWNLVDEEYKALQEGAAFSNEEYRAAKEYLENFRKKTEQPYYMKASYQAFRLKPVFINEFLVRSRNWYLKGWGRKTGDYITQPPWWYALRDLKKIIRAQWVMRRKEKIFDPVSSSDRYYLFPLHLQPEASTLVLSRWYVDQLDTIRNISKTLPVDRLLYVKEHVSALGRHSVEFYNEIKAIHNVRLIAPDENTPELICRSMGVIVLSSTMGWEALLLNRPVYILGRVFYQHIKGAERISHFEELAVRLATNRALETGAEKLGNDDDIIRFMIALRRQSFEGNFNVAKMDLHKKVLQKENIDKLYEGFNIILQRVTGVSPAINPDNL